MSSLHVCYACKLSKLCRVTWHGYHTRPEKTMIYKHIFSPRHSLLFFEFFSTLFLEAYEKASSHTHPGTPSVRQSTSYCRRDADMPVSVEVNIQRSLCTNAKELGKDALTKWKSSLDLSMSSKCCIVRGRRKDRVVSTYFEHVCA